MNLIRYKSRDRNNTDTCFQQLRKARYTIYAADPAEDGISIHDLDPTTGQRIAISIWK
jgi:tRNA (guanosine-2'-O-)-methyltransferase